MGCCYRLTRSGISLFVFHLYRSVHMLRKVDVWNVLCGVWNMIMEMWTKRPLFWWQWSVKVSGPGNAGGVGDQFQRLGLWALCQKNDFVPKKIYFVPKKSFVFYAKQSEKYCFCALKQQLGNIWIFTCGLLPDIGPVEKKYWAFTFSIVESAGLKFNIRPLDDNSKRTYPHPLGRL